MSSPASVAQPASIDIRGRFLWHELLTPDVGRATAFYAPVTGWTAVQQPFPGAPEPYTMFNHGTQGQAGVLRHPTPQYGARSKAGWMPYMGVPDADATCRDAAALGATVLMKPMDIPTVGRIAALQDPQGAQFAVIAPTPGATPEAQPVAGEFAWHEMFADDPDAALDFYMRLFGWTKTRALDMGPAGVYQMYGRGEFTYGGFARRSEGAPPTIWNCYIRVPDLDASCDALRAHGGTIHMGPHEVPNDDRVAICTDDQGAVFSLVGKITK